MAFSLSELNVQTGHWNNYFLTLVYFFWDMTETKETGRKLISLFELARIIGVLHKLFGPSNIEKNLRDAVQDRPLKAMQVWGALQEPCQIIPTHGFTGWPTNLILLMHSEEIKKMHFKALTRQLF